jgi:glutamate carboxypeptidase
MPATSPTAPSVPMRALLAGARRKEAALLDLTQTLVRAESPSDDKAAVDACGALAINHARTLGGRVKLHRQPAHGNVIERISVPAPVPRDPSPSFSLVTSTRSGRSARSNPCPAASPTAACGVPELST